MKHEDINILAMMKGEERYIFLYNEANRTEMLRTMGRYAADPQLSFSWFDAALLSKKVRDIAYADATMDEMPSQAFQHAAKPRRFTIQHEEDII